MTLLGQFSLWIALLVGLWAAVLGFSGFIGLGAIYFLIPRVTGRPIYSRKLAGIQYWMLLIGLGGLTSPRP